jgi:(p)ppGpp synthase/HD superfamily hydrolase
LPDVVGSLPKTRLALEFAEREHTGQKRSSDGAPFIEHPIEVGSLLYREGASDRVIAAGVLHDVLEKTSVTASALRARFGSGIAGLVGAVSEDPAIAAYTERKAALRQQVAAAGPEAMMIFAADKVSKVRELRSMIASAVRGRAQVDESLIPRRRIAHLRHCLGMLEERLGDCSLVKLLRTELVGLHSDLKAYAEIAEPA